MFKKLKNYFAEKKKKKRLQKLVQHEVLEMLVSIGLYLDTDGRRTHNQAGRTMWSHYIILKEYSELLRKEIIAEECKKRGNRK